MFRRSFLLVTCAAFVLTMLVIVPQGRVGTGATTTPKVKQIDLDGLKKLLVRDSKKSRPLLVNFWATWCEPCREEFPDIISVDADYRKRGLDVILISLDDPSDISTSVPAFLGEMRANKIPSYLLSVPEPDLAIKAVDVDWKGQLPATFLFNSKGEIVYKHTGRIKPVELRSALDKVVK